MQKNVKYVFSTNGYLQVEIWCGQCGLLSVWLSHPGKSLKKVLYTFLAWPVPVSSDECQGGRPTCRSIHACLSYYNWDYNPRLNYELSLFLQERAPATANLMLLPHTYTQVGQILICLCLQSIFLSCVATRNLNLPECKCWPKWSFIVCIKVSNACLQQN